MDPIIWIGIAGTVVGLGFLANGIRLARGPQGHAQRAGLLHSWMVAIFLPALWFSIWSLLS